jgi:putative membrane protein insertion efficiency factor
LRDAGRSETWRRIALIPIHIYRKLISPALRPRCRYYPSCSEYFEQAVMKYGVLKGSAKGFYRILRCHPFAEGGYDPP